MRGDLDPVIHVVDDDDSLRTALVRLLQSEGYIVKGYASAGDFLLTEPERRPGCMLLDVEMPGPSGLELQQALRRRSVTMPIVFMSAYSDVPRTVLAMKGGASDFLVKPIQPATLMAAVESALAVAVAPPGTDAPVAGVDALTDRERLVLQSIVAGRLNKQVAAELGVSDRTIKTYRASLMRKLGARSLVDLLRLAAPLLKG